MKSKIFIQTLVSSEQSDELYSTDPLQDFGIDEEDRYDYELKRENANPNVLDPRYGNEVGEIKISDLQDLIDKAKKEGATHVGVFYHGDHTQYEVYGYKYDIANDDYFEILKQKELLQQEEDRKNKIQSILKFAKNCGIDVNVNVETHQITING